MAGIKGQRSGGHNAKTRAAHELAGTTRKHRHRGLKNPEPPTGIPELPKPLTGEAKAEWTRMLARLATAKTLSVVDGGALFQYCRLFAETEAIADRQAQTASLINAIEEATATLVGSDLVQAVVELTKLVQHEAKYTTQIRQGRMAQRVWLVEFGLTPASRGRVKLPERPADVDPFAEFDDTITH